MSGVFISHASADKKYADTFVDRLIKLGCALQPEQIFYSSGADTGVPSGSNLMEYVRQQVGDANLVVALITPTYQTRPICIAELGAAWSRTGNLFPLLAPGMPRTALEGVLPSTLAKCSDDSEALDELKDRVGDAVGKGSRAATWGSHKTIWLSSVKRLAAALPVPDTATTAELARLKEDLANSQNALDEAAQENEDLQRQIEELANAKDATAVQAIRLPKDEIQRFEALVEQARKALKAIPHVVQEAVWHELSGHDMLWPDAFNEPQQRESVDDNVKDGLLQDNDGVLYVNQRFPKVRRGVKTVAELHGYMEDERSDRFVEWFEETYNVPIDLRSHLVWNAVLEG